jgi:glutathione S-transferase
MMMRLHDSLVCGNGYKVRLLLTQLGIPFERIEYDLAGGETRIPEFLQKVNPRSLGTRRACQQGEGANAG